MSESRFEVKAKNRLFFVFDNERQMAASFNEERVAAIACQQLNRFPAGELLDRLLWEDKSTSLLYALH